MTTTIHPAASAPAANAAAVTVLIVIPTLNEAGHVRAVVRRVLAGSDGLAVTVVVADGNSTDGTQDIVAELAREDCRIRLLVNPRKRQGAGLNLAAERFGAQSEFLIRIDAHAAYPEGYCTALVAEARRTGADSVVVSMNTIGLSLFQKAAAAAQNSVLGNGGSAHRSSAAGMWVDHGHHALVRMAAFRAVGGYDERFTHNEDAEFDTRLRAAGFRIWLTAKTRIAYFPRSTPLALSRQYFRYGQGRARTVRKHGAMPRLRQMLPLLVFPAFLLLALVPITPLAAVPLLAWALLALGYGLLLGLRARDGAAALSGVAAMIMHFAWSLGFWQELAFGPRFREQPA